MKRMKTETETSGYCGIYGDNVTWKLDTSTDTLTISGIGNMYDYGNSHINVFEFEYTPWTDYDVKEVIIEDGVLSVGAYAFYFCTSLNSAKIADGVKIIGERAFDNCGYLRSVDISDSVTSIGNYAFEECMGLESVTIENPDCEIYDKLSTFVYNFEGTIYGYEGSTAQKYAEEYEFNFGNLSKIPIPSEATAESVPETTTNDLIDASIVL